jgi:hypothetical protein
MLATLIASIVVQNTGGPCTDLGADHQTGADRCDRYRRSGEAAEIIARFDGLPRPLPSTRLAARTDTVVALASIIDWL